MQPASSSPSASRAHPTCAPRGTPNRDRARLGKGVAATQGETAEAYDFALSAASFLHSARNFLRSLPCRPLASASLEHSIDSAEWGLAIFLSAGAAVSVLVSDLAAGAVAWAKAELARKSETNAAMAARDVMVIVKTPVGNWKGT